MQMWGGGTVALMGASMDISVGAGDGIGSGGGASRGRGWHLLCSACVGVRPLTRWLVLCTRNAGAGRNGGGGGGGGDGPGRGGGSGACFAQIAVGLGR